MTLIGTCGRSTVLYVYVRRMTLYLFSVSYRRPSRQTIAVRPSSVKTFLRLQTDAITDCRKARIFHLASSPFNGPLRFCVTEFFRAPEKASRATTLQTSISFSFAIPSKQQELLWILLLASADTPPSLATISIQYIPSQRWQAAACRKY